MVPFIIVRHGYSIGNKEKRFSGQMDIPLDGIKDIPHVPNASVTVVTLDNGDVQWLQIGYDGHLDDKTTEEGVK